MEVTLRSAADCGCRSVRLIYCAGMLVPAVLCACAPRSDDHELTGIMFRTESDAGSPLPGVTISIDDEVAGVSDQTGTLLVNVRVPQEERVRVGYSCPHGHSPLSAERSVAIRPSAALRSVEWAPLEVTLRCAPKVRIVAIVIRASPPMELPVSLDGTVVATTDEDGLAVLTLRAATGTHLEVQLDTRNHPRVFPSSPRRRFAIGDHHDVVVFDQRFEQHSVPRRRRRRPRIIKIE